MTNTDENGRKPAMKIRAVDVLYSKLDRFIDRDRRAVRVYLLVSLLVLVAGLMTIVVGLVPLLGSRSTSQALLLEVCGLFISSLSGYPIKEYLARRDRQENLETLKDLWESLLRVQPPPEEDLQKIREVAWKVLEKGVTG